MTDGTTPQKKWAGKYESAEALEQGYTNLVPHLDQVKQEAEMARRQAAQYEGQVKLLTEALEMTRTMPASSPTYDDTDPRAYIDARFTEVKKTLDGLPRLLDERLRAVIEPITQTQNAQSAYMAQNPDYDPGSVQKFLALNPGINKSYQAMLSLGPEHAEAAFDYAYNSFRQSLPQRTSAVDQGRKADAGIPKTAVPAAPEIPGEGPSAEALANKANWAQTWGGPDAELDFMKEYFKGSNMMKDVESMKPDWAKE